MLHTKQKVCCCFLFLIITTALKVTLRGHLGMWTDEWKNSCFGKSPCQHYSSPYIKGFFCFCFAHYTWKCFIRGGRRAGNLLIVKQAEFAQTEITVMWHEKRVLAGHMFCYFLQIQDTHHQVAAAFASQATVNMSIICFISQDPNTCCTLPCWDASQKKELHNEFPPGFAG